MGNNNAALTRSGTRALIKRPEAPDRFVTPVADVYETAEAFVVKLDLPGTTRESVGVQIESDRLSVRAEIAELHSKKATVLFSEIPIKGYYREFRLGEGVNRKEVSAEFELGVLTITLPKTDSLKARKIAIR